jgi:hypothetical protein
MIQGRPGSPPLRLRAEDEEDLAVISACLQDALVAVRDLAYDPGAGAFVLVANRFRWEDSRPGIGQDGLPRSGNFERILCGLSFDNVTAAAYRGFQRVEADRILCLLAIRLAPGGANVPPGRGGVPGRGPDVTIDLDFAGSAGIRLAASALHCRARDFGDPWPTSWQPGHEQPVAG